MSLFQTAVFAVAVLLSAVVGDLLHNYDLPKWWHTVAILAMAAAGAYLANVLLVTAMLGAGVGWLLIGGAHLAMQHSERRRAMHERKEHRHRLGRRIP
ncbi:hypothetical protein AAEX63_02875 [Luteococcus sp. H138]|uniref:hypothetical protein n=1 Tax=unclassified Luteococcus TaxID=2639923 RepID=UPI00313D1A8D